LPRRFQPRALRGEREPYHESYHVLTHVDYIFAGGSCIEDISSPLPEGATQAATEVKYAHSHGHLTRVETN